jgi:hypothetical protein
VIVGNGIAASSAASKPGENYSRINEGRKELIDHVLVSAALVKPLDAISVEAIIPQQLPSITSDPNTRRDQPSSDHARSSPVSRTFEHDRLGRDFGKVALRRREGFVAARAVPAPNRQAN